MLLVKDLGEEGLLKIVHQFCPSEIVGDDAAVLTTSPHKKLVVTTDVLVENVHFSDRTTPAFFVGWRAATANLSDLAAMGAKPIGITVGLSLRPDVEISWLEELYRGIKECLDQYNTPIIGGDICRSSVVTISITALGEASPNQIISRSAAKPGDAILITGFHGLSKAGLELLLNPELGKNLNPECQEILILAHQKPQPRLDLLKDLAQISSHRQIGGMDSSDGLADAILQICNSSSVGAEIYLNEIPIFDGIIKVGTEKKALQWVLYGGEDFELVLCIPENFAQNLLKKLDTGATIIGKITNDNKINLIDKKEIYSKLLLSKNKMFQHF